MEELFEDKGLAAAAGDLRLERIRHLIAVRPLLAECASRMV
jgi:hypothetical protein